MFYVFDCTAGHEILGEGADTDCSRVSRRISTRTCLRTRHLHRSPQTESCRTNTSHSYSSRLKANVFSHKRGSNVGIVVLQPRTIPQGQAPPPKTSSIPCEPTTNKAEPSPTKGGPIIPLNSSTRCCFARPKVASLRLGMGA